MWMINAALLCIFMGITKALELNTSLLENKIIKIGYDPGYYQHVDKSEFRFVVSIASKASWKSHTFLHRCFGNMVSPWNAVSVAYCDQYRYGESETVDTKLHVDFDRNGVTSHTNKYYIESFQPMMYNGISVNEGDLLAFLTLENEVTFLTEPDLPQFRNEKNVFTNMMIGWNNIEAGQSFMKTCTSVANALKCNANTCLGQFCVQLGSEEQAMHSSDVGSPLFFNNEFVGVILRVEQNYALAVSVFGTRTEVGIGETTVPNYYPLRSDTVYKRRRV